MISAISIVGMAIGTAALVLILSVYNGFNKVIDDNLSRFDPDVLFCRTDGGVFSRGEDLQTLMDTLSSSGEIAGCTGRLDLNCLVYYRGRQDAACVRGLEDSTLVFGELALGRIGSGLHSVLGVNAALPDPMNLVYVDGSRPVTVSNPMSSIRRVDVYPLETLNVSQSVDERMILIPLEKARELRSSPFALSSVELRLHDGSDASVSSFVRHYAGLLPEGFCLKTRMEQNPDLYRMMKLEKVAVFAILVLVVLVVALNIFGSLSMLMMEKAGDVATLYALGADRRMTGRVFVSVGLLTSLLGMGTGLVLGVAAVLVQQHFGIIRMPGNFLIDSYPVLLEMKDVAVSAAAVILIGLLVSLSPLKKNLKSHWED